MIRKSQACEKNCLTSTQSLPPLPCRGDSTHLKLRREVNRRLNSIPRIQRNIQVLCSVVSKGFRRVCSITYQDHLHNISTADIPRNTSKGLTVLPMECAVKTTLRFSRALVFQLQYYRNRLRRVERHPTDTKPSIVARSLEK